MGERVIIKSERYKVGRMLLICFIIAAIICAIIVVIDYVDTLKFAQMEWEKYDRSVLYDSWIIRYYSSPTDYAMKHTDEIPIWVAGGVGVLLLLIFAWLRSYEIIVTDKRVYGKTAFGKRVDLPMDSISAVATKWPKGIAVATSSGKIAFLIIKNCDEIHKSVSSLLIDRQTKPAATTENRQEVAKSEADELKKYKELLDSGIVTQEEFDAKKKQLLGL